MMNKRGSLLDWFYIMGVFFMTGICIVAAFIVINTASEVNVFQDNAEASSAIQSSKQSILNMDNMMLFVIIGLSLFVLISSAIVFNHPAYFIVGTVLLFIAVVVAAVISNTFWTFTNQSAIMSAAANFPKITFLMEKLPFYIAFMGFASMITMFISYSRQQG